MTCRNFHSLFECWEGLKKRKLTYFDLLGTRDKARNGEHYRIRNFLFGSQNEGGFSGLGV